jgi:hypothetical protein
MASVARSLTVISSFAEMVELLVDAELTACLGDPLLASQTVLQVALPRHPRVKKFIEAQYEVLLPAWAEIYKNVGSAYLVELQPGRTWLDMAELFNTVIDGALIRARSLGKIATLSNGQNVLLGAIIAMLPALVVKPRADWANLYATPQEGR